MSENTLTVPILPLPDTVFFPHTLLPLHIFEPRYKTMIQDVLENDRLLGVVQLKPGWQENYYETPPIYKTLGVGHIIESDRLDDGRYDILLSGRYRTQIVNELEPETYRTVEVSIVDDSLTESTEQNVNDIHQILVSIYEKISHALPTGMTLHPDLDISSVSPGTLVDIMSSLLVDDPYERQSLLSETDIARRQQLLRVQIRNMFTPRAPEEEDPFQ